MKTNSKLALAIIVTVLFILLAVYPSGAASVRTPFTANICKYEPVEAEWEQIGSGPIYHRNPSYVDIELILNSTDRHAEGTATVLFPVATYNSIIDQMTGRSTYEVESAHYNGGWSGHSSFILPGVAPFPSLNNTIFQGTGDLEGMTMHIVVETFLDVDQPDYCPSDIDGYYGVTFVEGYIIGITGN